MSFDSVRSQAKPIINLIGLLLVISAGLKLFGVAHVGPGSVADDALVGIGLLHV